LLQTLPLPPFAPQLQHLSKSSWLPKQLVMTHMPELANAAPMTSVNVKLQLVLLPPEAADVSAETPAQRVIELRHDVTVRKTGKSGDLFSLAGLAFKRSEPVLQGWFLRCELLLDVLSKALG
jgi:hypothetical protein